MRDVDENVLVNDAILSLNYEYLQLLYSREYNLGRRIYKYAKILRTGNIKEVIQRIEFEKKIRKSHKAGYIYRENNFFAKGEKCNNVKGVVYTCITGGYDLPHEPYFFSSNCSYVMFSDNPEISQGTNWHAKSIPFNISSGLQLTNYANRFCKMHPFELFPKYEFAIYLDGNVTPVGDLSFLFHLAAESKVGIAMHEHPARKCIYAEGEACISLAKGNAEKIRAQLNKYREEGFPANFGMCEATVIVTDLRNQIAKKIFNDWWNEYRTSGSYRDQISFPYIVWKNGYGMDDIGDLGTNKNLNPYFRINEHY